MRTLLSLVAQIALIAAFSSVIAAQSSNDNVTPAKIVGTPTVKIPEEARRTGFGGKVSVQVKIRKDGTIDSVGSVSGPDWVCPSVTRPDVIAIREAARAAAMETKFEPATKNEKPVESTLYLTFNFPQRVSERLVSFGANPAGDQPKPQERYTVKGDSNYSVTSVEDGKTNSGNKPEVGGDAKLIRGGVLNGKALSLAKSAYPPAARAVRASGAVTIQVVLDEQGDVFSAEPISGHPLLRSASRVAACGSKFSPTTLSGQPVKVSGVITYNFVP